MPVNSRSDTDKGSPLPSQARCLYCHSDESTARYATRSSNDDAFAVRRCLSCSASFLYPAPTEEQLTAAYATSYWGKPASKFPPVIERVLDLWRRRKALRVFRLVGPGSRVLDIGCANGRFLRFMGELGAEIHGTELPGKPAEAASAVPNLHLLTPPLRPDAFAPASLDAITLWHVVEHLPDAKDTLEHAARWLRDGGILCLALPNIDSWQARLFRGRWFHWDPPRHLFLLGPRALRRKVEALGFRCVDLRHLSLEQNPFGVCQSILNLLPTRRDAAYEALKDSGQTTAPQAAVQLPLVALLVPLGLLFAALEAAFGAGGTIEATFVRDRRSDVS